jgi:CubicO group peptidase (beta-lactamase class C family)
MTDRSGDLDFAASPAALGFDPDGIDRLRSYMAGMVDAGRIAGGSTLLMRHGRVAVFDVFGEADLASHSPMTRETLFRIYSMTKPVTAVAMMILFEQGLWSLDDPVTRFIPEFERLRVFTGVDAVGDPVTEPMVRPPTMREIMSHTAGFGYGLFDVHPVDRMVHGRGVLRAGSLPEMIERAADIPLMFQPGTEWAYSIANDIQGRLVELLSGRPFEDFLNEAIFEPLGMVDTGFQVPQEKRDRLAAIYSADRDGRLVETTTAFNFPILDFTRRPDLPLGGGGLVSTGCDYARFCQMILNRGALGDVRVLRPESVDLMATNMIPDEVLAVSNPARLLPFGPAFGYGLGFSILRDPVALGAVEGRGTLAWGGGGGTWFWIDPENDLIFIGLIQRMADPVSAEFRAVTRKLAYEALTDRSVAQPEEMP